MQNTPVFAATHRAATGNVITANAALDGSGIIVPVATMGSNGGYLTHVHASATGTIVATSVRMFISHDGGTTWKYVLAGAMAAYTLAQTNASSSRTLIDRALPDTAMRLPAGAKVGFSTAVTVASNIRIWTEWVDF